jgi:hypothetical protein
VFSGAPNGSEVTHFTCGTCDATVATFIGDDQRDDRLIDRGDLWRSRLQEFWQDSRPVVAHVIFPKLHRQPRHAHQPVAILPHPFLDSTTTKMLKKVSTEQFHLFISVRENGALTAQISIERKNLQRIRLLEST